MPIPLLRFPFVVLNEIIKTMGFQQLFPLSLCSKTMHLVVKNLRDKSIEFKLRLEGQDGTVRIYLSEKKKKKVFGLRVSAMPEGILEGWTVDKYRGVVFHEDRDLVRSYWEDVEVGTRRLLEHVCDLFSAHVETVLFCNDLTWILDLVEQRQGPRSYEAYCKYIEPTHDQLRHWLVDLNPTSLHLCGEPSEQFRIENFHKKYDTLEVWSENWISGDNLLTLDCRRLITHYTTFTVTEINRFLRHVLIEGGAPRLTEFRSRVNNAGADRILDGIRGVLEPIPGKEQFEDGVLTWQFSGLLDRGDRSVVVSIICDKHLLNFFDFRIEQ